MKFIHLTDTHLVTPGEALKQLDPAKRLVPCIDSINRDHGDAECCIVTGDLADRGEDTAYQFLREQIDRSVIKCHLIPGNHDDREKIISWFPDTPVDDNGFIQYTVKTSAGVFVLLDTVQSGSHSGEFCVKRQQWLNKVLYQHRDESVFLFMHHPPFNLHLPCIDRIGLAEQAEFADIVCRHHNIRHLFFGHAHRPLSGNWKGISFSSLRGTNHQVGLDFELRQIRYVDEPPEYSIVFVSEDQIVVHTHSYPIDHSD